MRALNLLARLSSGARCFYSTKTAPETSKFTVESEKFDSGEAKYVLLKLNNPPVNRLNTDLIRNLTEQMTRIEDDANIGGVIFTSAVTGVFTAGVDIMEMYKRDAKHLENFWYALQDFWIRLYGSKKIYIAAMNGHALAFGCVLAMSCDYRLMVNSDKMKIGLIAAQLGITAPFWFQDTMINTIGFPKAERALQLGKSFTPKEALSIGLVDELVENEAQLLEQSRKQINIWNKIPSLGRETTKHSLRNDTVNRLLSQRDADAQNFISSTLNPQLQAILENYINSLKKKSK